MKNHEFEITSNEVIIRGTIYFCENFNKTEENPLVILLTGDGKFGRKGSSWMPLTKTILSINYSVCIFDFHGLGTSEGDYKNLSFSKAIQNLNDIITYIKNTHWFANDRIAAIGSSFGGGVALIVQAQKNPFKILGLRSPVSFPAEAYETEHTLEEMEEWQRTKISPVLEWHYDSYLDSIKYNIYEMVKEINCPIFIIHGNKDSIVPLKQSLRLKYILGDKAKLKILEGVEHNYKQNNAFEILFAEMKHFFKGQL